MSVFQIEGITFQPFNHFQEQSGFKKVGKLNVIIGPNNSGKSQLLRTVRHFIRNWRDQALVPGVNLICCTSSNALFQQFGISRTIIRRLLGDDPIRCQISILRENKLSVDYVYVSPDETDATLLERLRSGISWHQIKFPQFETQFNDRYLKAERDMILESYQDRVELREDGSGYTALALKVLQGSEANDLSKYGWRPFERSLLDTLNYVIDPARPFDRVRPLMKNGLLTLSLNAPDLHDPINGKTVDLSIDALGSGIKTVLMVIMATMLPNGTETSRAPSILYFEELENNLHPAAQTRLAEYLHKHVQMTDDIVFLSTHSQAFIDSFYGKEHCEIFRVTTSEGHATTTQVESCQEVREIFDDLGLSPSKLLFARGVIWVEGPSDRIYLKAWLDWKTENQLIEGRDYQFGFYGGACLNHYSAEAPDSSQDLVSMFSLNPNFFFVADRDTTSPGEPIKPAVIRICESINNQNSDKNGYWITFGPDIENYIPQSILISELKIVNEQVEDDLSNVDLWGDEGLIKKKLSKGLPAKVSMAREVVKKVDSPEWEPVRDWNDQLDRLIKTIKLWS